MKMRKVVSAMLVAAMATGMVAGCGSSSDSKSDKKDAKGKVYYLNFKPEQDEQWQDLAKYKSTNFKNTNIRDKENIRSVVQRTDCPYIQHRKKDSKK